MYSGSPQQRLRRMGKLQEQLLGVSRIGNNDNDIIK